VIKYKHLCILAALSLAASPANAEDDPNSAITAETARLNAEAARMNAEAALTTARAAKDKAGIEALGLPKFENKTELVDKGGAIETAMLASRALPKAAEFITAGMTSRCTSFKDTPIVVLGREEAFDLNSAQTMRSRFAYHSEVLNQAMHRTTGTGGTRSLAAVISLASAVAGLFGNDVKVSGVDLPEINDAMLANAVAGKLTPCAILPSAGGGIANIDDSTVQTELDALIKLRNDAAVALAKIPAKRNAAQKADASQLTAAISEFDAFYKAINVPEPDGKSALIRAILVERVATTRSPMLLRVSVNRSGGTITNSKNLLTFFGSDPVRVSGGLVASFSLIDARTGAVLAAGSTACQTTQTKLRNVQSGKWNGKALSDAICH